MADFESVNEALIGAVKALGGSKMVGAMLWPDKAPDAAQRLLLDCLNPERPAHLAPDQLLYVLRLARQRGHHDALAWVLDDLGYQPTTPKAPVDEAAELQRQFVEATRLMSGIADRLARLRPTGPGYAEGAGQAPRMATSLSALRGVA